MNISLIAAMDENRVIGFENRLPFRQKNDLKRFQQLTKNHVVIMGRKTFESLGSKPLPHRDNWVVTRQENYQPQTTVKIFHSLVDAIEASRPQAEVFILGGADIYQQALAYANKIYLTLVATKLEKGDAFFPVFENQNGWKLIAEEAHHQDANNQFDYRYLTYVKADLLIT